MNALRLISALLMLAFNILMMFNCGTLAKRFGLPYWKYVFFGFLSWPITIIVLLVKHKDEWKTQKKPVNANDYTQNDAQNDGSYSRYVQESAPKENDGGQKFCRFCGAKIPADSSFCEKCGNKL